MPNELMNPEEIQKIREMTGETNYARRISLPFINFNGRDGKFYLVSGKGANKEKQLLIYPLTLIILRIKKKLQTKMESQMQLYSREYDNDGMIELLNSSGQVVYTDNYKSLKEKCDVKLHNVIYVYVPELESIGGFCKMDISGASLGPLWEYLQSIPANDTILRYNTILESEKKSEKKGNMPVDYYILKLTKGEVYPKTQQLISELSQLNIQLSQNSSRKVSKVFDEEIPTIEVAEDEINLSDVPF